MNIAVRIILFFIISLSVNCIFCRVFHPRFFKEDEFDSLSRVARDTKHAKSKSTTPSPPAKPNCSEDKLIMFLAEIQVLNPESILKIATFEELNRMCRKVNENMDKTEKYLSTCTPPEQGDLYVQLIKGVDSLYQKLCVDGTFKKKFEKYHKCLQEMSSEFEDCTGPADWNEDSEPEKICAAYRDIADCYYIKSAKVCGKDAAKTMKELMIAIINSIITVKCNVRSNPKVKDAMPATYIKKTSGVAHGPPQPTMILVLILSTIAMKN